MTELSRRRFVQAGGVAAAAATASGAVASPASAAPATGGARMPRPADLQVDHLRSPLGIDDTKPTLSWRFAAGPRNAVQSAYQVRVATTDARLGRPDLWDSGKVAGGAVSAVYTGRALKSRERASWQVRVWDGQGRASAWSEPSHFEMGLLGAADWTARWIGNPAWSSDPEPTPATVAFPARSARYVRLNVTRLGLPLQEGWPYKVSRLQLAEVQVQDGTSGANLASKAPVTASESYTVPGQWEPKAVTDGSFTSDAAPFGYTSLERKDQALADPIWIQIDLGKEQRFDRILLYPRTDATTDDGRTANFPEDFTVQTSTDGQAFDTAATVTGQEAPPPLHRQPEALPVFAREFKVSKRVRTARLYATALGVLDVTVNGRPVSDAVLEPPYSAYKERLVYSTYDVTKLLHHGGNTVQAELGTGMAHVPPTPGRYEKLTRSDGKPAFLGQLEITYTDGSRDVIASGASWRTALGATTFTNWYGGEDHDARRTPRDWTDAITVASPTARLAARTAPPIVPVATLRTKKITEPKDGVYVVDLGTNIAGWPRLRVSGPAGTKVTMRPGELLNDDGTVSQHTTGSPIWDTYTLSGKGVETWHPRFVYHGFRYLQLEGLPSAPDDGTVTGIVLRAANEKAGSFTSSHGLLNDIHKIIDRAVQGNMYSVLTDCPHREKLGWLEQANLVFPAVARNYDVNAYYGAIVRDIAEAQTPDGLVPDIAPEFTVFSGGFRDDPNWGNVIVFAPWQMYRAYGDVATLRTYYPNMVRYVDYLSAKADGHLLDYGLGDWIAFDTSTPKGVTATFGYHRAVSALARIAKVIGEDADAAKYEALAGDIGAAFNAEYATGDTYGSGSQACDAFALDMGVVPDGKREAVLAHLVHAIEAKGYHLTVGEIALPSVFHVLSAAGRDDVIHAFATQTGNPSYGYQVVHGATSLTENWDGPTSGNSQNHFMLGAIDEWFHAGLAGLGQTDDSIAFETLLVRPAVVGDVTRAAATYRTPRGEAASSWRRTGKKVRLDVTVPPGTTARVEFPLLGGTARPKAPRDARWVGVEDGRAVFEVGSGDWAFEGSGS
ncbi:family 78 glycoside hydrolase catalytic domain [Actinomadura madurae]|uniref:family 78 glycoside hydrolase catalytic domain n=1 Tax=Actinomadura madurae TaxID=1993 RepID=UPI0020D26216|nr:family 78 glycoside hydrolase catalytic domain [Actinomadura madurae]MCP9977860.1 family 78 glycoside hydrolase catalytic domain [Actinomadura madurae]